MRCPICNSNKLVSKFRLEDDSIFADKGKLIFILCQECDFLFNPKGLELTPEDIKSYYQSFLTYDQAADKVLAQLNVFLQWRLSYLSFLEKCISRHAMKQMRILDIGGSAGQFCFLMKQKGFQCDLLDYSKTHVNIGKNIFRIKNAYTDIDQITEPYDLYVLNHVIEHIADPVDYVNTLLKNHKKKHIFISTPNHKSIGSIIYKQKWLLLREHHISLFSKKSIIRLYERIGLVLQNYDGFRMYSASPKIMLKGLVGNLIKCKSHHKKFLATDGLCAYGYQK